MKATTKEITGTSFHRHTVKATAAELRTVLGDPRFIQNDGQDKVNLEWVLETEHGAVFTVYDYKEYRPITEDEIIEWHIGGYTSVVTKEAQDEITAALVKASPAAPYLSEDNLEKIVNRIKFTATAAATKEWIKHEIRIAYGTGYDDAAEMALKVMRDNKPIIDKITAQDGDSKLHPIFDQILKPFTQG